MRVITSVFALGALVAAVFAADNPIIKPDGTEAIQSGKPCVITWTPTTGADSMVTLTLRKGPANNLKDVSVIVGPIKNTGSYTWNVDTDLVSASDYAIMITSPAAPEPNYTPLLTVKGSVGSSPSTTQGNKPNTTVPETTVSHIPHPSFSPSPTGTSHLSSNSTYGYGSKGNSTYGFSSKGNSTIPKTSPTPSSTPDSYSSSTNKTTAAPGPASGAMGTIIFNPMVLVACFVCAFMVLVN